MYAILGLSKDIVVAMREARVCYHPWPRAAAGEGVARGGPENVMEVGSG